MEAIEVIKNIEIQIRNNQFGSKEDLVKYINQLKNNKSLTTLTEENIKNLLELYDSLHHTESIPLDMANYKNAKLEDKNLIISQKTQQILETHEDTEDFVTEFKQTQNEIIANNQDNRVDADDVFNKMVNQQKKELSLISLFEAITRDDIQIEILNKLRFFITNKYINPYVFKINLETGIFYNIETNEVFEVRKNEDTNQYEIFKGSEKIYGYATDLEETPSLEHDLQEEKQTYEEQLNKANVKVRRLQKPPFTNNAAFTKVGFLIINILTFAILTTTIILLNK